MTRAKLKKLCALLGGQVVVSKSLGYTRVSVARWIAGGHRIPENIGEMLKPLLIKKKKEIERAIEGL